jgi:hypothetical protein
MRFRDLTWPLILLIFCGISLGQTPKGALAFSDFMAALENPDYVQIPELIDAIKSRGIAFELSEQSLGSIISNAAKGNRDAYQVAALILACMQACQDCRGRALAPMTRDELKTLMTWGFSRSSILEEARVRGVQGLEVSATTAEELRKDGADDDLINLLMPDDKMATKPPEGAFKQLALRRAEGYNPSSPKGWLTITADFPAKSQSEFIFKHNALFVRATTGDEPTVDLDASSFKKTTPRNTSADLVDFHVTSDSLDQQKSVFGVSPALKPIADYRPAEEDPDGRNAFRIQVANKLTKPQRCVISLDWTVRATPKSPPSGAKP